MNNKLPCYAVYSKIKVPWNYLYMCLFAVGCVVAVIGNTIALVVLSKKQMRSKSNKILSSLAVSDALVGYILFPFVTYQMFHLQTLSDCNFKYARDFIVYVIIGVSGITVVIIAYDRYILLTKVWNYGKIVTDCKVNSWICFSWLVPITVMAFNAAGKILKWQIAYSISRIVIAVCITLVLIVSIVLYFLISKAIRRGGRLLLQSNMLHNTGSMKGYQSKRCINLAKKVSMIIICYVICFIPGLIAVVIGGVFADKRTITETVGYHHFSLLTLFMASLNSCLNPIIYTVKYAEFRKCLRKTMRIFKRDWQFSYSVNKIQSFRMRSEKTDD